MVTTGSKLFFGLGALAFVGHARLRLRQRLRRGRHRAAGHRSPGRLFMGGVLVAFRDADPVAQPPSRDGRRRRGHGPGGHAGGGSAVADRSAPSASALMAARPRRRRPALRRRHRRASSWPSWSGWCRPGPTGPPPIPSYNAQAARPADAARSSSRSSAATSPGVVVFGFSRVMLASGDAGSIIFIGVAAVIMSSPWSWPAGPASAATSSAASRWSAGWRPHRGGIVGAAVGERDVEHHEELRGRPIRRQPVARSPARITSERRRRPRPPRPAPAQGARPRLLFVNGTDEAARGSSSRSAPTPTATSRRSTAPCATARPSRR